MLIVAYIYGADQSNELGMLDSGNRSILLKIDCTIEHFDCAYLDNHRSLTTGLETVTSQKHSSPTAYFCLSIVL